MTGIELIILKAAIAGSVREWRGAWPTAPFGESMTTGTTVAPVVTATDHLFVARPECRPRDGSIIDEV